MIVQMCYNSCNGMPVGSCNSPVGRTVKRFRFLNNDRSKFLDLAFKKQASTTFSSVKTTNPTKYRSNLRHYNTALKNLQFLFSNRRLLC